MIRTVEYETWSQKIGGISTEEFSKLCFNSRKKIPQLIENWNPESEKFQKKLIKTKEEGNKDAYYRSYGYSLLFGIAPQYYGKAEMMHKENIGVHRKLFYALNNCKVFSPTDDLFDLLELTDVKGEILANPPYPSTYISKVKETEDFIFWGVSMMKAVNKSKYDKEKWNDKEIKPIVFEDEINGHEDEFFIALVPGFSKKNQRYYIVEAILPTVHSKNIEIDFIQGSEEIQETDDSEDAGEWEDDARDMIKTVLGLFHFINSPNLEYVKNRDRDIGDKGNRKRVRKGKMPSPSHSVVTVDGQTKRYLDEVRQREDEDLRSLHWVRGHFRVLRDEDYWGERAGDRIWVRPHMKGDGDLIEQEYQVDKSDA